MSVFAVPGFVFTYAPLCLPQCVGTSVAGYCVVYTYCVPTELLYVCVVCGALVVQDVFTQDGDRC